MKKIILAAATLIFAACTVSTVGTEVQEGPYTITTISENVWHFQDCNDQNPSGETFDENGEKTHFNNCSDIYLIAGSKRALLIDLSNYVKWYDGAEESLRNSVASRIGDLPLTITFTHNHGDHTGMLPAYLNDTDVHFALPETDFQRTASRFPEGQYSLYNEGEVFDLGGLTVSTVMVPGHTAGSMVFFVDGRDILLSGDAIGSGHGVWIFDLDAFKSYVDGVDHLVKYIDDPDNGIDKDALRVYGGHFWQKDWFPELGDDVFGMGYIYDMQRLIDQIAAGKAQSEPSGLDHRVLDTYFRNGQAVIAWNSQFAEEYSESLSE